MAHTDLFRRQHDAVSQMMVGITGQIRDYRGRDDAYRLTLGIAQLLGWLRIHLSLEDDHLYPEMIYSGNRQTAAMAARFASEMGDFAERMEEFALHWSTSAAIATWFDEFRDETFTIFVALETRIRRENQQLYPLADRRAAEQLRTAPSPGCPYPREPSAAAASSTSSARISATGSSFLTMPTDWPAITLPVSTSPSITARRSAPAQ